MHAILHEKMRTRQERKSARLALRAVHKLSREPIPPSRAVNPGATMKGRNEMNKWFSEVFLPSLFERTTPDAPIYLTERQTETCERNMKATQHKTDYGYKTVLECEWNGRRVAMHYYGKYRTLIFGLTENEKLERVNRRCEKEISRKIERFQKHPKKIPAEIEKINREIDSAIADEDEPGEDAEYIGKLKAYLERLLQLA
jgi:hypothetical protein